MAHLEDESHFEYIDHDVTSHINVGRELDEIYHFASPASTKDFGRIPIPILKAGVLGTYNSLGQALAKGARLMLASSSEVYGDPLVHPQREDYWGNVNPVGVRGVYDEAKRYAEAITMAYHRHHKVDTRIVRISAHLQHLRAQDEGRRREDGAELHPTSPLGAAPHRLRRRGPEQERAVCGRPNRRRLAADEERRG